MEKDFDQWNKLKKNIDQKQAVPFCRVREIWWCSLGLNVGSEEDGKNELFERPVLILKVFNKEMIRIIPLTSKTAENPNSLMIYYQNRAGTVKISQLKTISTKRLSRKLCTLSDVQFINIINELRRSLI